MKEISNKIVGTCDSSGYLPRRKFRDRRNSTKELFARLSIYSISLLNLLVASDNSRVMLFAWGTEAPTRRWRRY